MTDPPVCQVEKDTVALAEDVVDQKQLEVETAEAVLLAAQDDLEDCLGN